MVRTHSLVLTGLAAWALSTSGAAQVMERVSVATGGTEAHGESALAICMDVASTDGRYVVFSSLAEDLIAHDDNGFRDVFLRDRRTGTTIRISVAHDTGGDSDGDSDFATISDDGRFIAYSSEAGDLVANDGNAFKDVFVYDRDTGATTRISTASGGGDVDGDSHLPSISGDGRFIAFGSGATNLVAGGANSNGDIYVFDQWLGTTTKVTERHDGSLTETNSWRPVISADGSCVVFVGGDTELVPGDTNGVPDVFVSDLDTGTIERVSVHSSGAQGTARCGAASVSADCTVIAFQSQAEDLVNDDDNGFSDIFVRDRTAATTTRVSVSTNGQQGNEGSWQATVSHDGRFVAFTTDADTLVDDAVVGPDYVLSHDRLTGITRRHSQLFEGPAGDSYSRRPSVTADGRHIIFESDASNFIDDDTNLAQDVYIAWGPAIVLMDDFESSDMSFWSTEIP
jgi:Tol biopolymer transport system component